MKNFHKFLIAVLVLLIGSVTLTAQITTSGKIDKNPAMPGSRAVLYQQLNYATVNLTSQDFEASNDSFDNQGADDFVVPAGSVWDIQTITAVGSGSNTFSLVNLFIYADDFGEPAAAPLHTYMDLSCINSDAILTIDIPGGVQLSPGIYWVSVQARADFDIHGQWYWYNVASVTNSQAMWRNPGNGFLAGALDWTPLVALTFADYTNLEFAFVLEGDELPYVSEVPLSNWALIIAGILIVGFTIIMIRKRF